MKVLRKDWPKVREQHKRKKGGGHYVTYQIDCRRKGYPGRPFKGAKTRDEALDYARSLAEQWQRKGSEGFIKDPFEHPKIQAWRDKAAFYNKTIDEIFQVGIDHFEKLRQRRQSPFMSALLNSWVDDKTTNRLKPLRKRSEQAIRTQAKTFIKDFGDLRAKEIDRQWIENYLNKKDVRNRRRKNILSLLSQCFNHAIKKGYIDGPNPCKGIEIEVTNGRPEFFTVEQCETIMKAAQQEPAMVAYFALCLFAGIRPDEARRLTWNDIDMNTKHIHVPHTVAKTKRGRGFVMEETLFQWLDKADRNFVLIPSAFRKMVQKIRNSVGFDWIQDGMRHSFASYWQAKFRNFDGLEDRMGTDKDTLKKWYHNVVDPEATEAFWSITPESVKKLPA
jgi:integrase